MPGIRTGLKYEEMDVQNESKGISQMGLIPFITRYIKEKQNKKRKCLCNCNPDRQ